MGISDIDRIDKILCDIDETDKVNEMKKYIQHGQISTYDHCMSVVKCSYKINKILNNYNLDLSVRAEQLSINIFVDIANNL